MKITEVRARVVDWRVQTVPLPPCCQSDGFAFANGGGWADRVLPGAIGTGGGMLG
ncbi:MAG TPA: hypothetical protein VM680_14550 [Verrucomicrobiae bacterium]|nr:hypothetical protein [Verrucomicrobiae bacterium]